MELNDFLLHVKDLDENHLRLKLHDLVRQNYDYKVLDPKNQEFILDLVMKHREKFRHGLGISQRSIDEEYRHIHENRHELNLLDNDLRVVKDVLTFFKK
jgi:hypothetical protein